MKKYFLIIAIIFCFYTFYSCNNKSNSEFLVESEFPYEKAKQAVMQKNDVNVLGYSRVSDKNVIMYIMSNDGKNNTGTIEFVLLSDDKKDANWLMVTGRFNLLSSDEEFELLK